MAEGQIEVEEGMSGSQITPQAAGARDLVSPGVYSLKSDLARFSLPLALHESYRKFAWANALCAYCLVIGLLGILIPPEGQKPTAPVTTDVVDVKVITPDLIDPAPPEVQPPVELPPDAQPLEEPVLAEVPEPTAVAELTPAVQFAIPVEGPTTLVPVERAAPPSTPRPVVVQAPTTPRPQGQNRGPQIYRPTYGKNEMIKPTYPPASLSNGEQGTVMLLVTVDQDGHILSAEINKSSGFINLDRAALRAAKDPRGKGPTGAVQKYFMPYEFQIQ